MQQATYRVRHHYRYVYTAPISNVQQQLIMVPPDRHHDQSLVAYALDVRGASEPTIRWHTDAFGNRVCRVDVAQVEHAIDFEVHFSVRRDGDREGSSVLDPDRLKAYLSFTALTAPDARLHAAALAISQQTADAAECAELANDWAAGAIGYQLGVTGTQTPAAMALLLGHGVCQDYAHIMLSVLRCLGIPARYVSGHLLGDGAPHAWVEVLLLDADGVATIVAYDPTHRRMTDASYITVATGRDFADVTPTSGVFSGAANGRLHWSKQAAYAGLP
jgi:transglutaminase-like putative cysteine protease